jgi:hypothetical protein
LQEERAEQIRWLVRDLTEPLRRESNSRMNLA